MLLVLELLPVMPTIAREVLPKMARPGWDYVLVAKPGVTTVRDFALLLADLHGALARLHKT